MNGREAGNNGAETALKKREPSNKNPRRSISAIRLMSKHHEMG